MENKNTEVVGTEGRPEEKLFTQEQVNEIVRRRLERQKETSVDVKELEERTAALSEREKKLSCREYLLEKGYNTGLMNIIDTSDFEQFKAKADEANKMFVSQQQEVIVAPLACTENVSFKKPASFGKDTKHKPKGYWATDPERACFEPFKGW